MLGNTGNVMEGGSKIVCRKFEIFEIFHAAVEKLKISNREVSKLPKILSRRKILKSWRIIYVLNNRWR